MTNCAGKAGGCDTRANLVGPEIELEGPQRIDGGQQGEGPGRRNMKLGLIDYLSAAGRLAARQTLGWLWRVRK